MREFLTYCGEARGVRGGALKAAIDRVCGRIALGPALETRMKELSKGWRQRAWLAQAILHDPPVLIMDEPTDGLDPNQKMQVRQLIRAVAPEKAILLSTHILEEAEEVCNRAIIIAGGRIVADDAPANLADRRGRLGEACRRRWGRSCGKPRSNFFRCAGACAISAARSARRSTAWAAP